MQNNLNGTFNQSLQTSAVEGTCEIIQSTSLNKRIKNSDVIDNFLNLKSTVFILPILLLLAIVFFLYSQEALDNYHYIQIQKNCFYFINSKLSYFPDATYNLTQLGDELIFLSILSFLFIQAPKIWECILSASLVSCLFSCLLKKLFAVPRPAAALDNNFTIIGKTLCGNNSLPSGHSITVFSILAVLSFAFIAKNMKYKWAWHFLIVSIGLIIVSTRIGVGAHYPLDVIIGGIIGYISGLLGIFISRKYKIWSWIGNKKYYPIFILLFLVCCVVLINKIDREELAIFYLSLACLAFSLYKITRIYVKK